MVTKCPQCKHYVSDTTKICPHCGIVLNEDIPVEPPLLAVSEENELETLSQPKSIEDVHVEPFDGIEPEVHMEPESETVVLPETVTVSESEGQKKVDVHPLQRNENLPESKPMQRESVVSHQLPPTPVASPPLAYQQAKNNNTMLIAIIAVLIVMLGVGGWFASQVFLNKSERDRIEEQVDFSQLKDMRIINSVHNKYDCFIVISKRDLYLNVYEAFNNDTILLATFPACLSKNYGPKQGEGDMKTPESSMSYPFTICQIQDASRWKFDFGDGRGKIRAYGHWFLRLDTGFDGIGIQGSTNNESSVPGRDSSGSIRLRDDDLVYLKENYAYIGMRVIIKHEDEGLFDFEKNCIEKLDLK